MGVWSDIGRERAVAVSTSGMCRPGECSPHSTTHHAPRATHMFTWGVAQQRTRTQSTRECFGAGHGISPGRVGCGSVVFAATTTLQPAAASLRQHTRPMPRDPPVTMATRPLRSRLPLSSWVRTSVTFCIRGRLMAREACCAQEEAGGRVAVGGGVAKLEWWARKANSSRACATRRKER